MKKNLMKLVCLGAVFAFGLGLAINTQKQPVEVEAAQHTANFSDYTYTGSYYSNLDTSGTDGLNGTFENALASYVFPKAWYTYSGNSTGTLGQELQKADEDPTNSSNMVLLYTRDSIKKTAATVSGVMQWNREHVWPQANSSNCWGQEKAGTDLLHLRPTYETTNSARGNKKYGYISGSPSALTYNDMVYGYSSGSYFEPLDSVKGDVARIIMYVWSTYNTYYGNVLNITNTFASYDTLLKWHIADKPDAMEGHRNDYVEKSNQKNRNPFVDHPEFAWRIFGDSCSASVKQLCIDTYPGNGGGQTPPAKEVSSIALTGQPNKKVYYAGDTFDPTGLTVTATYTDASTSLIPLNNCTWSPSPLTVGTTSVTCKYENKTAVYQGITVNQREVNENEFSVVFKSNSADGSSEISASKVFSEQLQTNSLIKSVDSVTKVFEGKDGIKMGSGSATGSITFTIVDDARSNIESIVIETSKYGSDSGSMVLKFDNTTISSDINPGTTFARSFDKESITTITISTSSKRAYLKSVAIYIASSTNPPISSSEPPVSSYESPVSSEQPVSSIDPVTSEDSTSFADNSSVITPDTSLVTSENNNNSPETEQPSEEKGCGGSIIASMSILSFSGLIGLVFALSKKKH